MAADWTLAHEGKNGWGAVRLNSLFTVDMRDVALRGWHDVGGECSVAPPECTEIRLCVTHALGADWREGCGTRATTASPAWVVRQLPYVYVLATAHVVYAHVTPPFCNPLGCRGERPLFVAPFSTELADV